MSASLTDEQQRLLLVAQLAASEARAAQWQADAEGYRIDAGVWRDRAEARAAAIRRTLDVCGDHGRRSLREPNAVSILAIREALAAAPEATAPEKLGQDELSDSLAAANARVTELERHVFSLDCAARAAAARADAAEREARKLQRNLDAAIERADVSEKNWRHFESKAAALRAEIAKWRMSFSTPELCERELTNLRHALRALRGDMPAPRYTLHVDQCGSLYAHEVGGTRCIEPSEESEWVQVKP